MKRKCLALLLAACMGMSLAGCAETEAGGDSSAGGGSEGQSAAQESSGEEAADSENAEGSSGEQADAGSGEEITLRFSWWGGDSRHEATLKAIETYENAHPGIKIEPEYSSFSGYYEKLVTQLHPPTRRRFSRWTRDGLPSFPPEGTRSPICRLIPTSLT